MTSIVQRSQQAVAESECKAVAPVAAIPSITTVPSNNSRETSEQEEGRHQAPDNEAGSNTEFDVRNALGREVLAHFELIISLVTFISVVVVIVKLASAIIPLYIRVAVWSMVGGWTSVQILLAISQRKEVDGIDPTTLLRTTMALEKKLHHRVAWFVLSLLLLPVFGYIAFIMAYRTTGLPFVMQIVFVIVCFAYALVWDGGLVISELFVRAFSCIGNRKRLGQCITGPCKQVRKIRAKDVINIWVFLLVMEAFRMGACFSLFECIDNPRCNPVLFTYSLWPMTTYLWFWFFFPALSFMISSKISSVEGGLKPAVIETAALIWNLFATAFIFTGTMMLYDANGTYKPGWLDWLGRLGRSIRVA
jgi:hypothetical protein